MDVLGPINQVLKEAGKLGEWEIGDQQVFALNDCTVIVKMEMRDGVKGIQTDVIGGQPIKLDITTGFFE